jgi:hypothetical protein
MTNVHHPPALVVILAVSHTSAFVARWRMEETVNQHMFQTNQVSGLRPVVVAYLGLLVCTCLVKAVVGRDRYS